MIGGSSKPTAKPSAGVTTPRFQDMESHGNPNLGAGMKKQQNGLTKMFTSPQEESVEEAVLKRSSVQGSRPVNVL